MTAPDNSSTTRLLHDLDAADRELSQPQRSRAAATLERILATEAETAAPTVVPDRTRRRRPRALLLAGGVVAAAVTAAVGVPLLTGGTEAFASWSATPVSLDGAERTTALEACLVLHSGDEGELAIDPRARGSVLLAEARGGWNYIVFTVAGSSGRELQGSCLVPDDLVSDPRPGEGGFFGSLGGAEETAGSQPAPDVVREDTNGAGSVGDEWFVYAEGRAGTDVTGIEVTTPGGVQVEASVENGHWAVWWPAGDDSPNNPDLRDAPTYEVTLRDGTVTHEIGALK
ncbi:hypothetical protein [Nocardioides mesophilus]|uniref:Uncharacterized protein n=1 Tax=Nocardioides mesophilus TaxID=433659 RepID=A0A7G9RFN5_9ACTN|nr:hypothetical protein [Nocardioides mesophilus]QNN54410.1 hypothetical protein H9L09_08835 [Nocardioides mesophilus]